MKLFRKNKNQKPEQVLVDTVQWDKKTGKPEVQILPVQIVDNALVNGRNLRMRPVDKLAYEYDRQTFDSVCQQFGLNAEEKSKLKALIFLNSGYVNRKILEEHSVYERIYAVNEYRGHYTQLIERLYATKQAALPPKNRNLYRLATYVKPPRLFGKSDVKDVVSQLLLAGLAIGLLALILPLIPSGNKGTDIYVRDESGNYVLDDYGRAITKQEECYENLKTRIAIGYGNTNGHCTAYGDWVQD